MCGDGTCAATFADCNTDCGDLIQCSDKCATSCILPSWSWYKTFEGNQINFPYNLFAGPNQIKNDTVILHINNTKNATDTYEFKFKYLTIPELEYIGPHPNWNDALDPSALTGAWHVYVHGAYTPLTDIETYLVASVESPESYDDRNNDNWVSSKYCMAVPDNWYWDLTDISPSSGLAHLPYIEAFRNLSAKYPAPAGALRIPAEAASINTPKLRWRCLNDPQFQWPVKYGKTLYDDSARYGIRLTEENGVYAMMYLPTKEIIPKPVLPKNRGANWGILGVAATILFVLLLIVGYKVLVQKK